MVYKIAKKGLNEDDKRTEYIQIDRCGHRAAKFNELKSIIPKDRARWIIYDFEYTAYKFNN